MFSSLMSPWQMCCLWHWCSAHRIWNVIHFFSISVRKGRVETRSYRLCFTYCRTIRHAFSIISTFWNGKQLTALARYFLMYSIRS
uniref:Putative secreted protein n=1 Tax=Anopheles triannulatus TaxID=58253 RepID=A0A2M4B705_9DIPT